MLYLANYFEFFTQTYMEKKSLLFTVLFVLFYSAISLLAQPELTNSLIKGNITGYTISGKNMFLCVEEYGVFCSSDEGSNWRETNNGLPASGVKAVTSYEHILYAASSNNVYISADEGAIWRPLNNGLSAHGIQSIAASKEYVVVGGAEGIFITYNNCTSWVKTNDDITGTSVVNLIVKEDYVFALLSDGKLLVSKNKGKKWRRVDESDFENKQVSAIYAEAGKVYAGLENSEIYVSDYKCKKWTKITNNLFAGGVTAITCKGDSIFAACKAGKLYKAVYREGVLSPTFADMTGMQTNTLFARDAMLFACTKNGFYASADAGLNWNYSGKRLIKPQVNSILVWGSSVCAGTENSGFFITEDEGLDWKALNNGLKSKTVYSLAVFGRGIFAGTDEGIYFLQDKVSEWKLCANDFTAGGVSCIYADKNRVFAGTKIGGLEVSENTGKTWKNLSRLLPRTKITGVTVLDTAIFVGTESGIFFSSDQGVTWKKSYNGFRGDKITSLITKGGKLYASERYTGVFVSDSSGLNWRKISGELIGKRYCSLAAFGKNLFLCANDGVYFTVNDGAKWIKYAGDFSKNELSSFTLDSSFIFAGTPQGIWRIPF